MAENKLYLAVGEEAARGTKEATTVGFIPMLAPAVPVSEFNDIKRKEFRGESTPLGDTTAIRMDQKWTQSAEMPFFTEAGTTEGMVATLLKHYFGTVTSVENASTGQFAHMMYPVADPFAAANLGTKALTMNLNINEGSTMKNWPYVGGRVAGLTFEQEPGSHLKLTVEMFGQFRDPVTAELGTPVFAAENLRCDYNNLKVYTGTITRVGTAPDYTDFTFGSATQIKPDKITVTIKDDKEDFLRLCGDGIDYPTKTRQGRQIVEVELTIDWEDPASGFSSVDERNAWVNAIGSTNLFLHWDTATPAGTGDNHGLYLDIPIALRMGGDPEYDLEKDPMITLKYEGLLDETTTEYIVGMLLKNTATAV